MLCDAAEFVSKVVYIRLMTKGFALSGLTNNNYKAFAGLIKYSGMQVV